jgi:DnaK suppressor protein
MNKTQAATVEKTLRTKREELIAALRQIDDIRIERVSEELDNIQNKVNRELAVADISRNSRLLREIDVAIERLHEGSHGICRHCEEEISPKRLAAIPWAALCITCQEVADLSGGFDDEVGRPGDNESDEESVMQNAA